MVSRDTTGDTQKPRKPKPSKEEREAERRFWDERSRDPSLEGVSGGYRRVPVRYG